MTSSTIRPALGRLRIRHLRLLEVLVEQGTVRKAAERLHVSQPVVSQMLRELESVFGGPLFARTRSGVRANERVAVLLRRVRIALGELEAAAGELTVPHHPVIRIGANLQFLSQLLPAALGQVWDDHPESRFILREGSSNSLIEALLEGDLDCTIARLSTRSLRGARLKELRLWPLYGGQLCLVVGRSHPLARRRHIPVRDLAAEPWALGVAEGQGREIVNRLFLTAGLEPPEPVIECRPQSANLAFVTRMPFVTVATRTEALIGQKAGLLHILPVDLVPESALVVFVCRRAAAEDPWLARVREAVCGVARLIEKPRA